MFDAGFGAMLAKGQVYVDVTAAMGGTGTIGSPYDELSDVTSIAANQTVYLMRGQVHEGTLVIPNGSSGVTVTGYGDTGLDDPVISGSAPLAAGASIVYAGADWIVDPDVSGGYMIRLDDAVEPRHLYQYDPGSGGSIRQRSARFPNEGWLHNESYSTTNVASHIVRCGNIVLDGGLPEQVQHAQLISYEALEPASGLQGAELVIRTANWQYERRLVQSQINANSIDIRALARDIGNYNWGFFVQGHKALIDQPGEWAVHCDGNGNWLHYLPETTGAPSGVRVSVEARGININTSCTGITISNIDFEHQYEGGITIGNNSNDVDIQYCDFASLFRGIDDKRNAAAGGTSVNHTVSHNSFTDIYDAGLLLFGDASVIEDNTFLRIGLIPGQATTGFFNSHGMRLGGQGLQVRLNRLRDIGYAGMNVNGSGIIERNHLYECLVELNDGGGIQFDFADGLVIRENYINGLGTGQTNLASTATISWDDDPSNTFAHSFYRQVCFGIYFGDKDIQNTRVERNVVTRCTKGIHVDHSLCSEEAIVVKNTLFNNGVQLSMTDYSNWTPDCGGNDEPDDDQGQGIPPPAGNYLPGYPGDVYEGNILYSLNSDQWCMEQAHVWPGSFTTQVDFGTFKNNFYFNPFTQASIVQNFKFSEEGDLPDDQLVPWTLPGWQTAGKDIGSSSSPLRLLDFSVSQELETITGFGNLFATAGEITAWGVGTNDDPIWDPSQFLKAIDLDYIFKGGALLQVDDAPSGASQTEEGYYRFTFDMRSTNTQAIGYWPMYRGGEYERFKLIGLSDQWDTYELLMHADDQGNDDYLFPAFTNLRRILGAQTASEIDLDNVSAHRVELDENYDEQVIAAEHILRYYADLPGTTDDANNVVAAGGDFTIPNIGTCWSDVHGNFYAAGDPITLLPWESIVLFRFDPPQDLAMDPNDEYIVAADETISENRNVQGRIIVEDGSTLTIDGAHIGFAESTPSVTSNITVETGGTLIVRNGANLRSWMGCSGSGMWDGVKVLDDLADTDGWLYVYSGARISDALVGALTSDADPETPGYFGDSSGGMVSATDASFVNNRFDVVLHGDPPTEVNPPPGAVPTFTNTRFHTTAPLKRSDLDPVAHLRVTDRPLVLLQGCQADNMLGNHTQSVEMGLGIESFNANVAIWPLTENEPASSSFSNLDLAVSSTAAYGTPYTTVVQSTFTNNICAVYLKDVPGSAIRGNEIALGTWNVDMSTNMVQQYWLGSHRGLFTTGSNALMIWDNDITRTPGGAADLEGIVVGYTGAENEVVYRNSASNMDAAFVGEGVCADVDNAPSLQGLQRQCDTNDDNEINFLSRRANGATELQQADHTIRGRQGTPTYSASNSFDGPMHFEVDTRCGVIEYVEYSYATGQAPTTYTQENGSDPDADYLFLPAQPVANAIDCGTGLPVYLAGAGTSYTAVKPYLVERKYEYGSIRYLLDQLIDGGSTDEVVLEIMSTWPQDVWHLRTYLLGLSPYLSVEAMKELVEKEEVPVAIKAEILVANPDATKSQGFLLWAETEAVPPLPGYVVDAIVASWDERTYRTALEEQVADKHMRLTQTVGYALHLLQSAAVPPPADTLRWVWQQLRTNRARYSEAALLMGQARYDEARDVIEAMPAERDQKAPEELERQRMLVYIDVLKTAAEDERNVYQLSATEVQDLEDMVADHYDRPANWASNLLCAGYNKCRAPYTGDAGEPKARRTRQRSTDTERPLQALFGAYPNPARGAVVLQYDRGASSDASAWIELRDLTGRLVHSLPMAGIRGLQVMDTRGIAPGTYQVQYRTASEVLHTEKLIIQQ